MSFEEERRTESVRCQNVRYVERPSSDPRSERVERIYFEERNSLERPDSVPNQSNHGSKHYENTTWYVYTMLWAEVEKVVNPVILDDIKCSQNKSLAENISKA